MLSMPTAPAIGSTVFDDNKTRKVFDTDKRCVRGNWLDQFNESADAAPHARFALAREDEEREQGIVLAMKTGGRAMRLQP